jgi:hypothetical protein
MNQITITYALTWISTACWIACFWWMHAISRRQDILLKELHEQTARIEKLSVAEHEMIKEVHPVVGEIRESVQQVAQEMRETPNTGHASKSVDQI